MKNLVGTLYPTAPTEVSSADGIVSVATKHLKAIRYPNPLNEVAVIGSLKAWHRSFLLRPKYGGRYLLLLYPQNNISQKSVIKKEFTLNGFNSAPKLINITIPNALRLYHLWEWRLVKLNSLEDENVFEQEDRVFENHFGRLFGKSGEHLAQVAYKEGSLSHLIYDIHPLIVSALSFEKELNTTRAKIALWSCHQPYKSEDGSPEVKEKSWKLMDWYSREIETFSPHSIWMLGDSSYSDGTSSLDFVSQVYGERGWSDSDRMKKDLLSLYRLNYRYHWSFPALQEVMRKFPHLGMWDDHEIRDGYGSDARDFVPENRMIKQIASQAAQEYLFDYSPVLRTASKRNLATDNHQIYEEGSVGSFIFDGRNSRNYGEDMPISSDTILGIEALLLGVGFALTAGAELTKEIVDVYRWKNAGTVISEQQMKDFKNYCNSLKSRTDIKYLLLGNAVPFIYILDLIEAIAAEASLAGSNRDDIRDSWHSPANRKQLLEVIDILRDLHNSRKDMEFINISGDIHISNAFSFQPEGFSKPLFQVTSSALTNNPPSEGKILDLVTVDGPLSVSAKSNDFGAMKRLWSEAEEQNFLTVETKESSIEFHLHVYSDTTTPKKDRRLVIHDKGGYELL